VIERAWHGELSVTANFLQRAKKRAVKRTHTLEKEGPVVEFVGFQQGAEESIQLRCFENDPRPGGRAAPKEKKGGGVCTRSGIRA
jgi:hypothetical protein